MHAEGAEKGDFASLRIPVILIIHSGHRDYRFR